MKKTIKIKQMSQQKDSLLPNKSVRSSRQGIKKWRHNGAITLSPHRTKLLATEAPILHQNLGN